MNKLAIFTTAAFAAVALSGCGAKPEDQLVGKWNFKDVQTADGGASDSKAQTQLAGSSMTFGKDKSFDLTIQGKSTVGGTWVLTDRKISITPTTMAGKPVAEVKAQFQQLASKNPQYAQVIAKMFANIDGSLSADGSTLTLNGTMGKGSMTYAKAAG